MKNLITFTLLTLLTSNVFSQNDSIVYFPPTYYNQFVLDSLGVPFIPLDLRADKNYNNESYIKKFKDFFNDELIYCPDQNTPYYDLIDSEELFGDLHFFMNPDGVISEFFFEVGDNSYRIIEFFDLSEDPITGQLTYYFKTDLYKSLNGYDWEYVMDPPVGKYPIFNKTYMD